MKDNGFEIIGRKAMDFGLKLHFAGKKETDDQVKINRVIKRLLVLAIDNEDNLTNTDMDDLILRLPKLKARIKKLNETTKESLESLMPEENPKKKKCVFCNTEFTFIKPQAKYCSPVCRNKYHSTK